MQQPVTRFCPTCGTDVEDVGGFCRLGHSLRVAAPTADLSTLKAEVDAAFEEAKLEVAAALGRLPGAPPPLPTIPEVVRVEPKTNGTRLETASAQATRELTPPPPPTGTAPSRTAYTPQPNVGANDPITAFAPPPHMDWGPQKGRFRRRK